MWKGDRRPYINRYPYKVKINNDVRIFPKFYCFWSYFYISLFFIAQILRIALPTIDYTASLFIPFAKLLQYDFVLLATQPFWNHHFFKIYCGLLVPGFKCLFLGVILMYFSKTLTRWLPLFFSYNFLKFFILKNLKMYKVERILQWAAI